MIVSIPDLGFLPYLCFFPSDIYQNHFFNRRIGLIYRTIIMTGTLFPYRWNWLPREDANMVNNYTTIFQVLFHSLLPVMLAFIKHSATAAPKTVALKK